MIQSQHLNDAELELQRRDFNEWLKAVSPTWHWDWAYSLYIQNYLKRISSGEIDRLMIFLHPRVGKSELMTIRYPVWRMENEPELKVIVGAYNQTLASKFSRKARKIAEARIGLSYERGAADDWETQKGGSFRAVGVGGGITGVGGNLILIDDPTKSREEANSATYQERVWDWFRDDLYTRLEPKGAIVLTQTRWHENDLAGRILASDDAPRWHVIRIPALAETQQERDEYQGKNNLPVNVPDPLGRQPGEATCPERFDRPELLSIGEVLGNSFYALYQQRPTAPEGDMFKREWLEIIDYNVSYVKRIRYWDKAGTRGGGAYTCGVLMGVDENGYYYVENVIRGQWSAGDRENVIRQTAEADGVNVSVWIEQEPGSGGKESAENTIRNLAGYHVQADRVTGDKVTRAEPLQAQCQAMNVKLRRADWNQGYIDRLTVFPNGTYADDVDASSGAFNKLAVTGEEFIQMAWWDACREDIPALTKNESAIMSLAAMTNEENPGHMADRFVIILVTRHPSRTNDLMVRYAGIWERQANQPLDLAPIETEIRRLCQEYSIIEVTYNPRQIHDLATRLKTDHVANFRPFLSSERVRSDKQLQDIIIGKRLSHDNNPLLRRNLELSMVRRQGEDGFRIVGQSTLSPVEASIALSMACNRCLYYNLG